MKSFGFAILGTGTIADFHRKAIEANADLGARLVAASHYDAARRAEISDKWGVPCLGENELLAHHEIDAICLCTPSGQHAAQTIAAARAGKHVLVEKPMALSLNDADAMIAACERAKVQLGVVLQRRADPLFLRVLAALQNGELGAPTLGVVTIPYFRPQSYYDSAAWRGTWAQDGGGALMNQGVHLVDLLIWWLGDPIEVTASAATLARDIEVEDTLAATLTFASGARAVITATTTAKPGFAHRLEVYGTEGGIQIEGEELVRWETHSQSFQRASGDSAAGAGSDPRGIAAGGHIAIVRDFIQSIREGRAPKVDGREGRRSLAAVLQIYRAAGNQPPMNTEEHG